MLFPLLLFFFDNRQKFANLVENGQAKEEPKEESSPAKEETAATQAEPALAKEDAADAKDDAKEESSPAKEETVHAKEELKAADATDNVCLFVAMIDWAIWSSLRG